MTTIKPEAVAYLHTNKENPENKGVSLHYDAGCTSILVNSEPLIRLGDYEALQAECDQLLKDARRLDWIESQAKKSPTGISFHYHKYVEDGYVLEHGFRFMRRYFASGFKDNIRNAIDADMGEQIE